MRTTEDLLIWPTPGNRCWAAFGEDQQDKIFALKLLHRRKRARISTRTDVFSDFLNNGFSNIS